MAAGCQGRVVHDRGWRDGVGGWDPLRGHGKRGRHALERRAVRRAGLLQEAAPRLHLGRTSAVAVPLPYLGRTRLCGTQAYFKMLIWDNYIHADLHPGNVLIREARDSRDTAETQPRRSLDAA